MNDDKRIGTVAERREVRDRLQKISAELDGLMKCVDGNRRVSPSEKLQAADRLVALKDRLEEEVKKMGTIAGREQLNPAERAFYDPAVRQAAVHLRIRRGSKPSPKWMSDLYNAHIDIAHMLDQLERGLSIH